MRFHDIRRGRRDEGRPDRRAKRARADRAAGAPALEALEGRVVLAVSVWSGATSNLWSVATNWAPPPAPGNDLSFPSTGLRTTNVNDLAADTPFGSASFGGAGYSITGNEVVLTGSITASQTSGVDAFNPPIQLGNTLSVGVTNAQATLDLGGVIGQGGTAEGLTKSGAGLAVLSGTNTYTGPTTVSAGTLQVDGTQTSSAIAVDAGGTLDGVGTVASISSVGGTVSPGDAGGPGILTDAGGFSLDSQSKFAVAIDGTTAGTGYGQVQAGAGIVLGGTLSVTLGTTPTGNQAFTLIKNNSGSGVTGTFTGLPEGSEVTFGGQAFRISYNSGASHDVVLTHLIGSSTAVIASPSSTTFGTEVTLTATVQGVGGGGTPTGLVEFLNGSTVLGSNSLNGSGVATLKSSTIPVGTDQITAIYEGDTTFATSTSPATTLTIAKAPTTTGLTVQPTSTVFGQPVTLTATVASTTSGLGTPTGNVEFLDGTSEIQTVAVNSGGVATLTTSSLPVGSDSITAVYQSDDTFATSTSPAVTATVSTVPTTATLAVAPTNPSLGQAVTLTATVAPQSPYTGTPTGTVTFLDGSTTLGSGQLNSSGVATFTTTALTGGPNVLEASYSSDGTFSATTSPTVTVTIAQDASTTTLTVSPNPSLLGQSTTLTATVMGVNSGTVIPTGTVQFFSGTTSLGSASVNGGVATLQTATLPLGTNSVTADYQGDVSFTPSTSAAVPVQVTFAATRVAIVPTIANPGPTQTEVFDVSVASGASGVTPTGTVDVYANGTLIGSTALSSGSGTVTVKDLPIGNLAIAAVYTGDSTNAASASAAQTLPVGTQVEQYLNAIYLDALGRQIDVGPILKINSGGLAGWLTQYVQHHAIRRPVVTKIVHSKETRQYAVQATYLNVAGKAPTSPQQQNAFVDSDGTSLKLNSRVFGGPAYYAKVGASIEAYLTALGNDILGAPLSASAEAAFTAELEHGTPRSTVVYQLLQTPQGKEAQVDGLYQRILGRAADPAGLKTSFGILNQGKSQDRILINLFSSPEFFNQFQQAK